MNLLDKQWLQKHADYYYSLILFIFYSQTPDHPKLYLWSEQGSKKDEEPTQDKLEECKCTLHNYQ